MFPTLPISQQDEGGLLLPSEHDMMSVGLSAAKVSGGPCVEPLGFESPLKPWSRVETKTAFALCPPPLSLPCAFPS